jgi:UDP-glucuronate decarboxylase
MRILVTGGAGFLGSHLSEKLLKLGHSVVCLDNFYTGNTNNVSHLIGEENFELVTHDITSPIFFEIDGIFNLACPASPIQYQKNPVETIKTNILGSINMLELARKTNARILQASTSEIYGDPHISPQPEAYWGNVNPIGIRACYDEGKRAAETLFFDFHRQHGVDIRVPRIFNTYGPRMSEFDGRVVSNFIFQALRGMDLTIYGDGDQIRSFCYVDDLVSGLVKLFFKEDVNEPINLGNPEPITIASLASEIILLTNSSSKIKFEPLPMDDPITREPDIQKARGILGWNPTTRRRDGLEKTIKYFEEKMLSHM